MGKAMTFWLSWFLIAVGVLLHGPTRAQAPGGIALLEVQGAISPATSDFIIRGIEDAEATGAQLLVIELDTPGGLDASMRAIIRRMLSAQLPIAVYVAPGGARAASAGTFILYASHIAAMTPASNLGAASPVAIGGGMPGREDDPSAGQKEDPDSNGNAAKPAQPRSNQETSAAKAANDAAAY